MRRTFRVSEIYCGFKSRNNLAQCTNIVFETMFLEFQIKQQIEKQLLLQLNE